MTLPKVFDCHFHIIDKRFPLVANNGFLPEAFTCEAYLEATQSFERMGGAIVSGSFQSFDQSYLVAALQQLGPRYVGVTQIPSSTSDAEILRLDAAGVRAVRFNLNRGGSAGIEHLESLAKRVHEMVGWHVEIYVNSAQLPQMVSLLMRLPAVSIDHLGLCQQGLDTLLKLVERGVHVKATGFGRVDFDVRPALAKICAINPNALMFGTDLPSTRAPRPYVHDDLQLILNTLEVPIAQQVLYQNALTFYRLCDL